MKDEENELDEMGPWLAAGITLVGALLRLFLLNARGLGLEETFSLWLANHSVGDMLQWVIKIDQHPPLYYLLLHYWMELNGKTPYDVRLLSAALGAGTIPIIYLIGKRMSGTVMGLAAAVILALSPFNIRLAQEARMYTCMAFNAAVAIYALVRLLTDPRSARPIGNQFGEYLHAWRISEPVEPDTQSGFSYGDEARNRTGWRGWIFRHRWLHIQSIETDLAWVAFIVFSAATLLSHHTAILFPLATNILVLGLMLFQRMGKPGSTPALQAPSFWNWVKAQIGIFLLWSPWIFAAIQQAGRAGPESWIQMPRWDSVTQVLRSFLNEDVLVPANKAMITWVLYTPLLCLGLAHYWKRFPRFLFLATLFAIPFVGELIASIRQPIFQDRTLIWTTIPLFLVLAGGVAQLRFRILILVAMGILGTNNLSAAGDNYRFRPGEDWSTPAGYVAYFAEKDDLVLFNSAWAQIPFDYYFKPFEDKYSIQVEKHGVPVDMFQSGIPEQKVVDSDIPKLISLSSGHNRVWLVYTYNWYTDPEGLIPQTLASQNKLLRTRDFYGGQVQLYGSP